ncbi:MAG: 3-dehydroquinate synthase, partial [Oscillospiraceae bacterium]
DVFDQSERQRLNFGHTIGHAIEQCSDFKIAHGHAVAIGMVMITRASVTQKLIKPAALQSLIGLLKLNGLPYSCNYSIDALYKAALNDKKRRGDSINLVVPTDIGVTKIMPIRTEHLYQWLQMGM